ncbi:uncharacterized protein [Ptychodera flava]|uniref:uncharacterized protein n=1 Tax=Ptychodera flava TaxID=63121 RepID=UPI003969D700
MSKKKEIFVRHARVNGNLLPLRCVKSGTIHDLALAVRDNAKLFDLNSDEIKIHMMHLTLKDDKGNSRKLEFSEPISVIQKNYTVEFNEEQEHTFDIPVRYIGSVNPIRIPYKERDVVSDLSRYIDENIAAFKLAKEVTEKARQGGSEVVLMEIVGGNEEQLHPSTSVRSLDCSDVAFKIKSGARFEVLIKHGTSTNFVRFQCSEDDDVSDLARKIKERIASFNLTNDDVVEVMEKGNVIILKTIASKSGDTSRNLDASEKVTAIDQKKFEFSVRTKESIITIDDIKEKCNDVNIAFVGAPGHGKSSTINTIINALSKLHIPVAETWKGSATGTFALTPHKVHIDEKIFTCIDVPGKTLQQYQSDEGKDKSAKVIRDVFDGKLPANEPLEYWEWYSPLGLAKKAFKRSAGVIHAVAYVHKGVAEPDKLGNTVIEVAQKKGRGIPVFVIITHSDLMSEASVTEAADQITHAMGIDKDRIFQVSNLGYNEKAAGTKNVSKEDAYVQRALFKLLSAADSYKHGGIVNIKTK